MGWSEAWYQSYLLRQQAPLALDPQDPDETPEAVLLAYVRELARQNGYLVYHTYDSRRSEEGFPDVVLCSLSPGRPLVFAELKSARGKPTMKQLTWLAALRRCLRVEAHLWRPADRRAIARLLQGARKETL